MDKLNGCKLSILTLGWRNVLIVKTAVYGDHGAKKK